MASRTGPIGDASDVARAENTDVEDARVRAGEDSCRAARATGELGEAAARAAGGLGLASNAALVVYGSDTPECVEGTPQPRSYAYRQAEATG